MGHEDAAEDAHASAAGHRRYRAVFISDLHLGTPGCQAVALLDFLKHHPSEHLYLVGDIVDGWQLRRKWFWPQAHNDVVQKLLRRARKGCRVVFVPGNHDEFARAFVGHSFGGIEVRADASVLREALAAMTDAPTWLAVHAERAVSRALGGSCSMPLAAFAQWQGAQLHLEARLGHPEDARVALIVASAEAAVTDTAGAEALGLTVVARLRAGGGEALLAALPVAS